MISPSISAECGRILKHLKRIQGQITVLQDYIARERSCEDVAHLLKSVTASFASVRSDIVEEMLMRDLASGTLSSADRKKAHAIVSVLQK